MPKTDDTQIVDRIRIGQKFVERGIAQRDKIACKRFLDGSEAGVDIQHDDFYVDMAGVLPNSQEVGNVNYLGINILTKVASVAIGDPDWHVEAQDPDHAEIVRRFLRDLWRARHWARICRKALLKRSISGMGVIAYLWHETRGPVLEHVKVMDLAIDPNVIDWFHLRWAGRKIKLPREEAEKRWPDTDFGAIDPDIPNMDETTAMPSETVELWVYWDTDTEAILYGSDVLERGENLYGRVPLIFLEGDIAPESEFSLGDYDCAVGLQIMLARLQGIINNQAENGGAIPWYNPGLLDDASKDAFANGRPQGAVAVNTNAMDVFGYVSGEPMSPVMLDAFRIAQQGLDSATGVSEYQRGVLNQSVKFATEAALLANQSGSRGNQARIEYEQFLDEIARAILDITRKFGIGMLDVESDEDLLLYEALTSVNDLSVIESSTAYKDPAYEMQSSLQFSQAMMPFMQMGIVDPRQVAIKLIRAFGERNVQQYLRPAPMPATPNATAGGTGANPLSLPGNPAPDAAAQEGGMPQAIPGGGMPPTLSANPQQTFNPAGNAGVH